MNKDFLLSSESVSEGHPDKIADQISDGVLDAILEQDPEARVACETLVSTGLVLVGGEISTSAWVDINKIARSIIKKIGYDSLSYGFDWQSCSILSAIGQQSPDISQGVNRANKKNQGAGDQGLMFGYASNETATYMPAPIFYAHQLMQKQSSLRKNGNITWLCPDAKAQVTFKYENNQPKYITSIVFSTQHTIDISYENLKETIIEEIIKKVIPHKYLNYNPKLFINPTGRFVIGGPMSDCGVTGRKIIVDTYGGAAHHGGGAFSGKDPSKVDRSASYVARYIAKNIVASGIASRCEICLSYAIGIAEPVAMNINTFDTTKIQHRDLETIIRKVFDLTPYGISKMLNLKYIKYLPTASYGHFGRTDIEFPWEKLDKVMQLQEFLS